MDKETEDFLRKEYKIAGIPFPFDGEPSDGVLYDGETIKGDRFSDGFPEDNPPKGLESVVQVAKALKEKGPGIACSENGAEYINT